MADYKWQVKAVFAHAKHVISAIVAACGTGKTRAGIRLGYIKHLPVIVIAPKNLTEDWRDAILAIAGEHQKVWIHDADKESRKGDQYLRDLLVWLKEESDDLIAPEGNREQSR